MRRKPNNLWISINTGPLCKYAKCNSTILPNQEDTAVENRAIWRGYSRFSRTIARDYVVLFSRAGYLLSFGSLIAIQTNSFLYIAIGHFRVNCPIYKFVWTHMIE